MDAVSIIFTIAFTIVGWSDVFAYVSIRDAYLPGFKILPSVQFFARMWHVAILVTSGLCRAIYWPPSAASTIYLLPPLLFSSPAIARYLLLSFPRPFLLFSPCSSVFFSLPFVLCILFCAVSSLSVSLAFFPSRPSLTIELNQCWNATFTCTWTSISQTFCFDILQYRQLSGYKLAALWII